MTEKKVRYRTTVRHDRIELRGYVDSDETLTALADAVQPLDAMVIASPVDENYDPWAEVGWLRDWQSDMLAFIKSQKLAMTQADYDTFAALLARAGVEW